MNAEIATHDGVSTALHCNNDAGYRKVPAPYRLYQAPGTVMIAQIQKASETNTIEKAIMFSRLRHTFA
ncbi:hypothetical protein [Sandarakinorhabdus sp.]|uniref:hypothetical protein n=1 Tax=Sandarakinorhabdus sp. TaxID=1916663 RepID=UPI00286DDB9C|nr:hypothetical protein [Sandarakinorhabdus sp.]